MNALKEWGIIFLIAIFLAVLTGCAGVERKCIEDALGSHWADRERLEALRENPEVNDTCEVMSNMSFDGVSEIQRYTFFRCDKVEELDDSEYALLVDMQALGLRVNIKSCLR